MRVHDSAQGAPLPFLHRHRRLRAAAAALLAATLLAPTFSAAETDDPRIAGLVSWLNATADATGLPRSHVGDENLENWTFTYDAASAALAYLAVGQPKRASKIIDYYLRTRSAFRLGGVIEAVNPSSRAVGEDYGVRAGSNIWLGIAAYHLFRATRDVRYLRFAKLQADFALSLQIDDPRDPNDGAVRMGPVGGGQTPGDQHLEFDERLPALFDLISTENNLDAYALFGMIAREAPARVTVYRRAQTRVLAWLTRVAYDRKTARFVRGASRGPDTKMATDVQCWAISALGRDAIDALRPGATDLLLDVVEREAVVSVPFRRPDGTSVTVIGVDFVDAAGAREAGRSRMVSPEWTFQLANAYSRAATGSAAAPCEAKRAALLDGVFRAAVPSEGGTGFPYATLADAPVGHGWNTPREGTLSAVGVAWGILALTRFDPLRTDETSGASRR